MVIAETYYRDSDNGAREWINPADVEIERDDRGQVVAAKLTSDGQPVQIGAVEKMSKSKNNGVDPQTMVRRFGADTVRLFSMFAAPPDQSLEWNEAGVEGMSRFLKRLWRDLHAHVAQPDHPMIRSASVASTGSLLPPAGEGAEGGREGAEGVVDVSRLDAAQRNLRRQVHETINKVSDDFGRRHAFNTAIAALME